MHANMTGCTLTIAVPYPDHIRQVVAEENCKILSDLAPHLDFTETQVRVKGHVLADDFVKSLDFKAVRAEFRRKAKKFGIDLPDGDFPVNINQLNERVELYVSWRKK